ncbi:MAG: DUF4956 domain-containing protein [Defluviitaleaceae bacterium]|nr:DUF4956 domain-containing protein [Defluviitaleaceae bacterium]
MLETLASSITTGEMSMALALAICTFVSLVLGLGVAGVYRYKSAYSQGLATTLVLMPALVQIVIMLASGNIGVGVALAGAFSLIRFRSVPGNARDIGHLFLSMGLGFVTGLGYLLFAVMFLIIIGGASLILTASQFGRGEFNYRMLRIKIPENLDYDGLFDDILAKYTTSYELDNVRTTQMGSLYELSYTIRLKTTSIPKAFIDELRVRNGNLSILLGRGQRDMGDL